MRCESLGMLVIVLFAVSGVCRADCWGEAEARFAVSRWLLLAIAQNESGMDPARLHRNADGSYDIGLMQINSAWLPRLRPYGIGITELRDPCVNLNVGAWILANDFAVYGKTWRAVGAYNARSESLRIRYAWQVAHRLRAIVREYGVGRQ